MPSKDNGLYEDYLAGSYSWGPPPRGSERKLTLYQDDLLIPTPQGISAYQNQESELHFVSQGSSELSSGQWNAIVVDGIMTSGIHGNPLSVGDILDKSDDMGYSQEQTIRTMANLIMKGWVVVENPGDEEESY